MKKLIIQSLMFLMLAGFCFGLTWQDDSAMAAKFDHPTCFYNGYLVGGFRAKISDSDAGIILADGQTAWYGGYLNPGTASYSRMMWGVTDVGVFACIDKGAEASCSIWKCQYGREDFAKVIQLTAGADSMQLGYSFVDCGWHDVSGTDKRILMLFEYVDTAGTARVWLSDETGDDTAGDNGTWTDLFGADAATITHFHGAKYIKGKGLYVMTGDSPTDGTQNSILYCADSDIDDLVTNPATWDNATHWGLATGTRTGWSTPYSSAYVVEARSNRTRTAEMVYSEHSFYFIPDQAAGLSAVKNSIIKLNTLDTTASAGGTLSVVASEVIPNTGWYGGVSKSGMVYLSDLPYSYTDGRDPPWYPNHDGICHIYALDPSDDSWAVVKSIPRQDYNIARGIDPTLSNAGISQPMVEYGGAMFGVMADYAFNLDDLGDSHTPSPTICGRVDRQAKAKTNLHPNGDFTQGSGDNPGLDDWYTGTITNNIEFTAGTDEFGVGETVTGGTSTASAEIVSVTVEAGAWATNDAVGFVHVKNVSGIFQVTEALTSASGSATGNSAFMTMEVIDDPTGQLGGKVCRVVQASGAANTYLAATRIYSWPADLSAKIEGVFCNYSCRIYIDSSTTATTTTSLLPRLDANMRPGEADLYRKLRRELVEDTWHRIHLPFVAGEGATINQLIFTPDYSYTDGDYMVYYLADFELVQGASPNYEIQRLSTGGGGASGLIGGGGLISD